MTSAFQERLRGFLQQQGVAEQVTAIGPPSVFPLVHIRCTPRVAELIKTLPDVEDVVRDGDGLSMSSASRLRQ